MEKITTTQRKTLTFINDYYAGKGYPPTIQEIATDFGIVPNAVQGTIMRLLDKGLITKKARSARSIVLTSLGMEHL